MGTMSFEFLRTVRLSDYSQTHVPEKRNISPRAGWPGRLCDGLFPFRSPLLRESIFLSFPPLSDMLKFSGYSLLSRAGVVCALFFTWKRETREETKEEEVRLFFHRRMKRSIQQTTNETTSRSIFFCRRRLRLIHSFLSTLISCSHKSSRSSQISLKLR